MDVRGFIQLHVAAKRSGKDMIELFLRRGARPISAYRNQEIPLLMAVRALNIDGADQLLRAASDLSMTNMKKQTTLHVACQVSSMPIV
jgi:ankyrin repeat protein